MMFIFIACVPFVFSDAVAAIAGVPDRYVETAQTLGATPVQIVAKGAGAAGAAGHLRSLRHLFGLAFGYIMLAELINAEHGLGYLLMTSQRRGLSEHIILILIIIGTLAYGIDRSCSGSSAACSPTAWSRTDRGRAMRRPQPAAPPRPPTSSSSRTSRSASARSRSSATSPSASRTSRARRVHRHPGAVGLRQVDGAAADRRTGAASSRPTEGTVLVGGKPVGPRLRSRHGVPGLHVVRQPHRRGQRRLRPRMPRRGLEGAPRAGARVDRQGRPGREARRAQVSERAVRAACASASRSRAR